MRKFCKAACLIFFNKFRLLKDLNYLRRAKLGNLVPKFRKVISHFTAASTMLKIEMWTTEQRTRI